MIAHEIQFAIQLQLVISGSALLAKYGSAVDFMKSDGFQPNSEIYHIIEGESLLSSAKSSIFVIVGSRISHFHDLRKQNHTFSQFSAAKSLIFVIFVSKIVNFRYCRQQN